MNLSNHAAKAALSAVLMLTAATASATGDLPPWLDVSGNVNFDAQANKEGNGLGDAQYQAQDAELRFEILAREGVKLVIKAELEKVLNKYIKDEDLDTQLGQMLEEAYIEIQTDKFGLPRAIVTVGKQRMAFGQRIAELPMFKDSLLHKLNNEEEMIGFTVTLPPNFFKVVDTVAISLYETGAGDLKISKEKGATIQLSKKLTQQIEMQVSALMKQHEGSETESRGSIGFVYTSEDGAFKVWAEGVVMKHNPEYLNSRYAATVGAAVKMGRGAVVIEASMIEKVGREIALAYNLPVGSNLILSPEVRYIIHENGDKETVVGIRARIEFGKSNERQVGPR